MKRWKFSGARIPDSSHRALSRLARRNGHTLPQFIRHLFDAATAGDLKVPAPSPAQRASDKPAERRPQIRTAALRISEELAARMTAASAITGLPASDLLRIGLIRLLAGIEHDGFLRAGPKAERAGETVGHAGETPLQNC